MPPGARALPHPPRREGTPSADGLRLNLHTHPALTGSSGVRSSCPRRVLQANRLRTGVGLTATRPGYVTALLYTTDVLLPDTGCSHSATEPGGLSVGPRSCNSYRWQSSLYKQCCCVQEMKAHSYNNSVSFPPWCLSLPGLVSISVARRTRQSVVVPCAWGTPSLYLPPYIPVYPIPYNLSSAETWLPSAAV